MREYEMIQALSGKNDMKGPKSGFALYHEIVGSDGSSQSVDGDYFEKPEIRIYRDFNNIVKIDFIYEFSDDLDLLRQYSIIEHFFQPENSCNFTEEDLSLMIEQRSDIEDGEEIPEEEIIVLHSHALTLNIISLSPRGKISLTTRDNPLFYSLVPERPNEPARILRMIYQRNDVSIDEMSDEDSLNMERNALEELETESINVY